MKTLYLKFSPLLFLTFIFFSANSNAAGSKRTSTEISITRVGLTEMHNHTYTVSNDMRHVGFRMKQENKFQVVVDTSYGPLYDEVGIPVFSTDCKHFAYWAKDGDKLRILVDHTPAIELENGSRITFLHFNTDNKSLMYVVIKNKKQYLVVNGKSSEAFDSINENSLRFAGTSIAYSARDNGRECIVLNGKKSTFYEGVGFPEFHPDGKRVTYWYVMNGKKYVYFNKKKYGPYSDVGDILFSPDGKEFLFHAIEDDKHFVVLNGSKSKPYHSLESLTINPVTDEVAFVTVIEPAHPDPEEEEYTVYVIYNGEKQGPYEQVILGSIFFSHDGKNMAYCGQLPIHEIVNGVEIEHTDIEWFAVYNGVIQQRYNMMQGFVTFSPDGKHHAYAGERGSRRIVNLDGVEKVPYDDIFHIAFSPDNKKLVYSAKNKGKEFLVIDEKPGNEYDTFLGSKDFYFDSPNSLHYLAIKNDRVFLVQEQFE